MTDAKGPYSRIYWSLVDDPVFERVYDNDRAFALWVRMLLLADATYPASAPMPHRSPTLSMLIGCSLVQELPGNRYTMRGLRAERERRSSIGRNAAAVRHAVRPHSVSSASKDETSKEEKVGANASTNGATPLFMGFPPKKMMDPRIDLADIDRQQNASLEDAIRKTAEREAGK